MDIDLIRQHGNGSYLDCFDEMEESFLQNDSLDAKVHLSNTSRVKNIILQILLRLGIGLKALPWQGVKKTSFSMLMGASFSSLLPYVLKSNDNYIYMFDAWPRFLKNIAENATVLNIKLIFFSSNTASNKFNQLGTGIKGIWIPEGINPDQYYFEGYENKTIDVLEFGRKFDDYHNQIVSALSDNGFKHLYEKLKGQVVFKTRKDFLHGLAQSKISICIPSNITHPERSEGISSMTLRYLQSMASKCLIIGVIPDEMKLLFSYNPIIEIDTTNPGGQILDILHNFDSYIPLIEKNYIELHKFHTWHVRTEKMLQIMKNGSGN